MGKNKNKSITEKIRKETPIGMRNSMPPKSTININNFLGNINNFMDN